MVRSTSLVCCLISASVFASSAAAQGLPTTGDNPLYNVWNALGRHGGVGWSDGYHRCPPPGPASWDQGMQYAGPPAIAQPCPNCWQPQPMLMDPSAYATPELAPTYAPTWQPPSNPYAFPMVSPPDQRADFTTPQIIRPESHGREGPAMNRPDSRASETAPSTAAPRDPREEVPPPSAQAPTEESTGELPPRNGATGVQTPRIDPELMGPEPPSPYDTPTPAAQESEGLLDTPPATTPPANSGDDDLLSRRGRSVLEQSPPVARRPTAPGYLAQRPQTVTAGAAGSAGSAPRPTRIAQAPAASSPAAPASASRTTRGPQRITEPQRGFTKRTY